MRHPILAASLLLTALSTLGCRIDQRKGDNGDDVKIATPFGGLAVKTDNADVLAGMGLPLYSGATLVKKDKPDGGKDNTSADVNLSFGSFQLRVKAAEYHSNDDPRKLFDFYKKALGRFGAVLQCENDKPVGSPTRTPEGLTCEDEHHADRDDQQGKPAHGLITNPGLSTFDRDAKIQLKAGSRKHQHIVDINPDNGGTRFSLIALDLPLDFHLGDKEDKNDEKEKQ